MSLAKRKPNKGSGVLVLHVFNIVSFLFLAFELLIKQNWNHHTKIFTLLKKKSV